MKNKHIISAIIVLSFVLLSQSMFATSRRALVIGIGDYPKESGWEKINGDKDIPMVEEMLTVNGFKKSDIVELKNEQATYSAICKALSDLVSLSEEGDMVYIHFSGHGQQITDLSGDEKDGLDEAWVPYDACQKFQKGKYEGENHLLDDQLNRYLHNMREKVGETGKIIVIADACHSGEASRDLEGQNSKFVVRGTADVFVIPNEYIAKNQEKTLHPINWIFISACKPYQCNYEYNDNGSLTYAMYQQKDKFSELTSKQLNIKIKSCISNIIPFTQTPVLETAEGEESNIFF